MYSRNRKYKFILLATLILISNFCIAQQQHFIYIQSDNRQPFYVKMDSKILSSTSSGYAIIPKLLTTELVMQIGFPKNEFPPQTLSINVKEDAGYNLKNFGDGKWGLFNLQTMQVVYANDKKNESVAVVSKPKVETAIEEKEVVEKKALFKVDSMLGVIEVAKEIATASIEQTPAKEEKSVKTAKLGIGKISKTKEQNNATEYIAVYKVTGENTTDYIDVVIAKDSTAVNIVSANDSITPNTPKIVKAEKIPKAKKTEEKFLDMELPNPNSSEPAIKNQENSEVPLQVAEKAEANKKLAVNSDCVVIAGEDDFFDTRKAMASKRSDEAMIVIAMKSLKKKCYSASYIKGLGTILLQDSSRLAFFKQAYSFASDPQNFEILVAELNSSELKDQLKAFINK